MDVYQKNLETLYAIAEDLELENQGKEINKEEFLSSTIDGNTWSLQSHVSMEMAVQTWCDQFVEVGYYAVFFIFGMGYVGYLLELAQRYPENLIVLYEPDETIILKQLESKDMTKLLQQKNIYWVVGKNRRSILNKIIDTGLDYKNGMDIRSAMIPNYRKMYKEEAAFFLEQVTVARNFMGVSKNTKIVFEEDRGKSYLYNILDLSHQASVQNLIDAIKEENIAGIPAVLIAAGPSLDNNIMDLLPYQEKVFIICLDSAVRTAARWGIIPDLLICVDPRKNPELFDNELGAKIPLISHMYCNYNVTKKCGGRRFYSGDRDNFEKCLLERYHTDLKALSTGGTVANTAFSLLREMGFQTIILIGQDLAYPGKRTHTVDANDEREIAESSDGRYFYVDGIDGNPVLSEFNMCLYRQWFEEQIIRFPDLEVIDATEGGALIKGTKIMTLKEALMQYCQEDVKNFGPMIQKAEYLLPPEEQEEMEKTVLNAISSVPTTIDILKQQTKVYDELDLLNRKGKYNTASFKRCIANITDFNHRMDEDLSIMLMQLFANKGDYQVYDKLQKKCDSKYEEIKLMVEVGRQLIDTYIDAGGKLLEAWGEIRETLKS